MLQPGDEFARGIEISLIVILDASLCSVQAPRGEVKNLISLRSTKYK
jgi:hypothetical protein